MKYENVKFKDELSQEEYISLVDAISSIQLFENEEGELEYHPQYLTTTLPSIIALYCLDGIEFDEKDVLFDKDFIDRLNADKRIHEITQYVMYDGMVKTPEGIGTTYPHYYYTALEDANKIVQQKLKDATASGKLFKLVSAFMVGVINGLEKPENKSVLEELVNLKNNTSEKKTLN